MPPKRRAPSSPQALLGQRVRAVRLSHAGAKRASMSQEALAEKVGVHRTYVGQVERGEVNIALSNLLRLAEALDLDPGDLIRGMKP